jgi:polyhydroxyalkanoate synthesis regulator phasin
MATHDHVLVDADGATITSEPSPRSGGWFFELPVSLAIDVARMGVQLGIGLAAMAVYTAQRVASDALDRGAKLEQEGLAVLGALEREQVTYMKDYLRRVRGSGDAPSGAAVEAHVEEALKTHDVPTRDDIRELHEQIAALDEKVSKINR